MPYFRPTAPTQAPRRSRRAFAGALLVALLASINPAVAEPLPSGRPSFRIHELVLPKGVDTPKAVDKELRQWLKKAAKQQDWGGAGNNKIEARFELRTLSYRLDTRTLHITATLMGRLPSGRHAESTISFGGAPSERTALTRQVLRIVATGVVTRLADIERKRRGL